MAQVKKRQKRKELKREYVAILSHYQLLRGLALISNMRIRQFLDVVQSEGRDKATTEDGMNVIRQKICQVAGLQPRARMLLDVPREIDAYVWVPMQLFFCAAWALVQRYRYLKGRHPELLFTDLDGYIEENSSAFDAVRNLRDWVLHPGYARKADDAMEVLFFGADGKPVNSHPQDIVNQLLALAAKFLGRLNEHTR